MALYFVTGLNDSFPPIARRPSIAADRNYSDEVTNWLSSNSFFATQYDDPYLASNALFNFRVNYYVTDDIANAVYVAHASTRFVVYDLSGLKQDMSFEAAVEGTSADETFSSSSANQRFVGREGTDLVRFSGAQSDYTYKKMPDGSQVVLDRRAGSPDGADLLFSVERIGFTNAVLAFDEVAAQAYRVYQAAFGRTPDREGLSYWVDKRDDGLTFQELVGGFVGSAEFRFVYGASPVAEDIVGKLYQNVLGRAGEPAGVAYWVGLLNRGSSLADVVAGFSESPENRANLVPIIGQGVSLDPGVVGI